MSRFKLALTILILLSAGFAEAQPGQPFPRGQWSQSKGTSGALSYLGGGLWTQTAGTNLTTIDGGRITTGMSLGTFRTGTDSDNLPFDGFTTTGAWDSTRRRFLVFPAGGHGGISSFEINEADFVTGTWNPDGRPQEPVTKLVRQGGIGMCYLSSEAIFFATCNDPTLLLDPGNFYTAYMNVDPGIGSRTFPNTAHNADPGIYMPTVQRFLFLQGYSTDWGGNANHGIFEWDPIARKWQGNWADYPGSANPWKGLTPEYDTENNIGVWDASTNTAIIITKLYVYRYDPAQALGSRMTRVYSLTPGVGQAIGSLQQGMLWDSKRKRIVAIGAFFDGGSCSGGCNQSFSLILDPSPHGEAAVTITGATNTLITGKHPGFTYDARSDRYLLWYGGKTVYWVDPVTWVATAEFNAASINPGTREFGTGTNGGYVLHYDTTTDTYVTITAGNFQGFAVYAPVRTAATVPRLYFTDLPTGTRINNSDTSKGQTVNADGVIVTLWGTNLGSSQGASTLTIGGAAPRAFYYWGSANNPNCGPANLDNNYMHMQCIVFQIAGSTPLGSQNIQVTVNGNASNTLPFLVTNSGAIRYIGTCASGCIGSYTNPYTFIQGAFNANPSGGDYYYVKDGVYTPGGIDVSVFPGTSNIALIAYPQAATIQISDGGAGHDGASSSGARAGTTYSKLKFLGDQQVVTLSDSSRVSGSLFSCPNGASPAGCLGAYGGNVSILGNEFTNAGTSTVGAMDPLYHTLYLYGRRDPAVTFLESGREIGWNYIHDNSAFRAVNLYNGSGTDGNPISDHVVHDNVIVNQEGDAVLFGRGVVGANSMYNNLVINAGKHIVDTSGSTGENCVDFQMSEANGTGASVGHAATVVKVYNNTFLNCGFPGGSASGTGVFFFFQCIGEANIFNNIIYQKTVSSAYYNIATSTCIPSILQNATKYKNNLWFGLGSGPPAWDTGPVLTNPLLASDVVPYDLHLQSISPAINAGTTIVVNPSYDFDSIARPSAGSWDLGAYEYGSTTPATTLEVRGSVNTRGGVSIK